MDSYKVGVEADSEDCAESEMVSISDSSSEDENSKSRGREAKHKMKLRSIRLSRLPSLRSCMRPLKSPSAQSPDLLSGYAASSEVSTRVVTTDASPKPNYTKPTSCSDLKNGNFQKPSRMLSRRSSFKQVKSLTRVSSTKFRGPLMRISSGGTNQKKKLKKTRSIKIASTGIPKASIREENAESSFCSNNRRNSKMGKPKSDSSAKVLKKTTTLRPQRILTKTASLKPKRPSKKCSEVSEVLDSSIVRATCSSTLKDSKFSPRIEQQTGGSESGVISAPKVCPYSYCSLHGHRHGNLPPLKRFVSMRRRLLKAQKSMKPDSHPVPKAKHSSNRRKGTKTSQMVYYGGSVQQQAAKDRRENSSLTDKAFKVELKGEGTHRIEDVYVSENLPDILFGETSCLQSSLKQDKTSNSLKDKPRIQIGALSTFQETNEDECCNKATEHVKPIPEASDSKRTVGEIVASGIHSGDNKFIHTVDHPETMASSLPEVKDSIQSDNLSLKLDDIVSTSNEGGSVNAAVNQEVNGETVASLNLEMFKGHYSGSKKVLDVSTATREFDEGENEDFEPDNCFHEGFSQSGDPVPNFTTDGCHKTQIRRQKFTGFWGLIYQHMVSGIATEVKTQLPLNGKDREEEDEEDHTLSHNNDPVSHQSSYGTDQDMKMRDSDAGNQKFELWQSDAVKLVQEAFDKILSEIPDQSSDDQSITSDTTSEQDLLERKQVVDGEDNISSSFDGTNESVVRDPEETQLKVVNSDTSEERKAASQPGDQSSQKISKNWSNLKKVIILKKFVKALEKVRNFNPRKPQCLPVEPDSETEKVNLRQQTTEERKNAEEWMLDFALRQVISKLAPAQKRKVTLLVQAFETVSPLPETRTHMRSNATASALATPAQATSEKDNKLLSKAPYAAMNTSFKETVDQVTGFYFAKQLIPGTCPELKERSLPCGESNTAMSTLASEAAQRNLEEEKTIACNLDKTNNNPMFRGYQPDFIDSSPTKPETSTLSDKASTKLADTVGTSHEELVRGKILKEIYDLQVNDLDIKFNNEKLETNKLADEQAPKSSTPENYAEPAAVSRVTTSASFCELLEAPATPGGEAADQKFEVLQESSPLEEPESNNTTNISEEDKMEKQKYTRLWYLIYKHMVSSSTEGGTESLGDVDNKEQGGETKVLLEMKNADSCKDSSELNQETIVDNKNGSSRKIELDQIEAVKLIEEAIDEIQLPEIQNDTPDDQSITGNMNPEMETQKKHGEDGELFILTTTATAEDTDRESRNRKLDHLKTLDQRETQLNSNSSNAPEEPETVSKLGNKSKPQVQKSWSNLKKLILLKRFIKALEKVRKFNPREPRYLPLDPDLEAEKVHLRRQSTEDTKNAEEWMLDYALQQVVAKLTPARKRKVELLVEAFETVTPTLEVKDNQRHSAAASPAKLILA